mmetsp:Transcript_56638/g.89980  ORF Transcript_56638/g.89980 Transcript_56638/m.89980 type:complete len:202 (-) Transcript_56638:162-767(-)
MRLGHQISVKVSICAFTSVRHCCTSLLIFCRHCSLYSMSRRRSCHFNLQHVSHLPLGVGMVPEIVHILVSTGILDAMLASMPATGSHRHMEQSGRKVAKIGARAYQICRNLSHHSRTKLVRPLSNTLRRCTVSLTRRSVVLKFFAIVQTLRSHWANDQNVEVFYKLASLGLTRNGAAWKSFRRTPYCRGSIGLKSEPSTML